MLLIGLFLILSYIALVTARITSASLGKLRFSWEDSLTRPLAKRDASTSNATLKPYTFTIPIDHFKNVSKYEPHSNGFFDVTYYFDASYYKPGGPVVFQATGDGTAEIVSHFVEGGLPHQLAKATNGIAVVLEHRYYGNSFPVPDLSVKNLRFLTTEQALADAAYFAQHITFPGVSANVTSSNTPWIASGAPYAGAGYAGAFVAYLRTQFSKHFWGAISSSGTSEAIFDFWQYTNPIMDYGPQQCIETAKKLTDMIDNIFESNHAYNSTLRKAFGLDNVTLNQDVVNAIFTPVGYWQLRNWNPVHDSPVFFDWCGNLTASTLQYKTVSNLTSTAETLLKAGGYSSEISSLTTPLVNWFGYVRDTAVRSCDETAGPGNQDECFAMNNPATWEGSATSDWPVRSWTWQFCNQYGFFTSGGGRPKGNLGILSRLIDIPYLTKPCDLAFGITTPSRVDEVNAWGGFGIHHSRLFFVGGEADPWRESTPLSEERWKKGVVGEGKTTTGQDGWLIRTENFGAVHGWDQFGVPEEEYTEDFPPRAIQEVQSKEAAVVKQWVDDWHKCQTADQPKALDC